MMDPHELGSKYDKIAPWWHEQHRHSSYGMTQLGRALGYTSAGGAALDVGCGAGGRMVRELQAQGFQVTGLDVSQQMIQLAVRNHPDGLFLHQDICTWQTEARFELIIAWDSIFHLPLQQQRPVIQKLCTLLAPDGILLYSFGNAVGEHTDTWHDDSFYYSSIGINANLTTLLEQGLTLLHLELDQFPDRRHAYLIAQKQAAL